VDVPVVIRHRLRELGLDQKDLAAAAQVTESYISQLLARKKAPPAPDRTDLYDKMGRFLRLPSGELSKLAELQRQEDLKKRAIEPPRPLFSECRALILRKCEPTTEPEIRTIFEKEHFGALERFITQKLLDVAKQKLLDVAKRVAHEELESEDWLRVMAELSHRSYEQILEFLDTDVTDVFHISVENCVAFLNPVIESWDIDLRTFGVEVVLNRRLSLGPSKRFEFVERQVEEFPLVEPGLEEFLRNESLSGDATEQEIEFLKALKFRDRRPTAIYYYRELQNLRDPFHFRPSA
jgi:transcriptional regulator with XRE-family HTH domain